MRKITLGLIIGIILIIILTIIAFVYYATAVNNNKPDISNPIEENPNKTEIVIEESHLSFLLNEMGAYKLHNPPLSNEKPRINIIVDESSFKAEIDKGYANVEKGSFENPDIIIKTSREEVIGAITSLKIKEYMKNSVTTGKTSIKLESGYTELFSKGYLNLYQDLTGKSFTGSVVRIFSQG